MGSKPIAWVGGSLADLRSLSAAVRREFGHDLHRLQLELAPRDAKPMPQVGPGVVEIRVRLGGAFRLLYVAKFEEAIYVLHVFQKKSQQTARLDLDLGRSRYAAVVRARR